MIIPWKEEYELGIASIDAQHKKLIDIINALSDAIKTGGEGGIGIEMAIDGMKRYAEGHLSYEEALFEKCGYEESEEHRVEHDLFRETLREFQSRSRSNDPMVAIEMLGYLEDWFLHHVLETDRRYVEAFKAGGIG